MECKNKKINLLGDSITEGIGASSYEKCYASLLDSEYGMTVCNYGISGTRVARQKKPSDAKSFDLDMCGRAAEMDKDADIVAFFGGTNDYGHGDAEIGSFADRTPDTFYGGLHYLFKTLMETYPEAFIFIITPLHRKGEENPRGDGCKLKDVAPLKEYVKIIREVADFYSLPVLDLYANSGIFPDIPVNCEKYTADGVHPNDRGHRLVAERIADFLSKQKIL